MLTYNLVLVVDVGCGEVDHDVHDEHDVNWNTNHFNLLWSAL